MNPAPKPEALAELSEKMGVPTPLAPPSPEIAKHFTHKNPTEDEITRKKVIKCVNTLHDAGAVVEKMVTSPKDDMETTRMLNNKIVSIARQRIKQARKQLDKLAVELNKKGFA